MRTRSWTILLLLAAFLCRGLFASDNTSVWSKGWTSEPAASTDLRLIGVDQSKSCLSGLFVYYNMSSENDRTKPIFIAGVRSLEGTFWADATLQVKKTTTSEWETIRKYTGKGQPETITVGPNDASKVFQIDFDDFKGFMLTHKVGRVIISTGATKEFNLEALSP